MDAPEIHRRLAETFGDKIQALVVDNPDPYVVVDREVLREVALRLRDDRELAFDFLESIAGVDTGEHLWAVYHLFSYVHRHQIVLRVPIAYEDTVLPSVSQVWPAANWHEREQYDLFGFEFSDHPDLRRILLPEDWIGWPLRKAYEYPEEYHEIDHYRPDPKEQFKALDDLAAKAAAKVKEQREAKERERSESPQTPENQQVPH